MNRPSFNEVYMAHAHMLSKRSTCSRLQVGAVIVSEDYRYVYGQGYNSNATGLNNCCDTDEPGNCGCIHAECNAIINCTVDRDKPKILYLTHSPCLNCSKMILNMGNIKQIVYKEDYRDNKGLDILRGKGINIQKI